MTVVHLAHHVHMLLHLFLPLSASKSNFGFKPQTPVRGNWFRQVRERKDGKVLSRTLLPVMHRQHRHKSLNLL